MTRPKTFKPEKVREQRKRSGLNQRDYWTRFGVTQSGGSRYESGRNVPLPMAMLIWLRESGKIDDRVLADAMKAVKATR